MGLGEEASTSRSRAHKAKEEEEEEDGEGRGITHAEQRRGEGNTGAEEHARSTQVRRVGGVNGLALLSVTERAAADGKLTSLSVRKRP